MSKTLRVAMIGYGFMGKVHSHAWRSVNHFFPDAPQIEMTVICGRSKDALEAARVTIKKYRLLLDGWYVILPESFHWKGLEATCLI